MATVSPFASTVLEHLLSPIYTILQSSLGVEVCTCDGNDRRGECSTGTHRREPFASFHIERLNHVYHSLKAQL